MADCFTLPACPPLIGLTCEDEIRFITVSNFLVEYPEFKDAPISLVQAKLQDALILTPCQVWSAGLLRKQGTFLHCARLLALSPFARHMKLVNKDGSTLYDSQLLKLKQTVTSGFRVL